MKHTFAICAYKESPYLESCIDSIINQTVKSDIIVSTSTPCDYIKNMCNKYNIPCYVNEGERGITQDWNFAYSKCKTKYVTIAHQDDLYFEKYTENMLKIMEEENRPLIFFSDYFEVRNDILLKENLNLKIKRILLSPLKMKCTRNSKWIRRRILAMGCSICCPSVTFARENLPEIIFNNHFRTDEDWEAWEKISKFNGAFLYCSKALVGHRIHEESETTATIKETGRSDEDYEMFCKFWPKFFAKILTKLYSISEKSNEI